MYVDGSNSLRPTTLRNKNCIVINLYKEWVSQSLLNITILVSCQINLFQSDQTQDNSNNITCIRLQ